MSGAERPGRVLMVGRYFWPLGSFDAGAHLMQLASGLSAAGIHVSVLVPKFAPTWAETMTYREIRVDRPVRLFRSGWTVRSDRSLSGYLRTLRAWIEANPLACDLVYCDWSREEAIAVVEAARGAGLPSVVRLAGRGRASDLANFATTRSGGRCRWAAQHADALVVDAASVQREWIAAGGRSEGLVRIDAGFESAPEQSLSSRANLRRAMSRINGDLFVPETCSVVLSVEPMRSESGIQNLVAAAYGLSQRVRGLQFWFVGDGPARESIYSRLRSDGLRQSVAMPGSFGQMMDVFVAADLMVHVGDEGYAAHVPAAVSAAIPLVVANTTVAREFFSITARRAEQQIEATRRGVVPGPDEVQACDQAGELVWWFDPGKPSTLRKAISAVVENLEAARRRARRARQLLQQARPRGAEIDAYGQLFRRLIRQHRQARVGSGRGEER